MIYVGIPVHDERHTIGPLLWRIRQLLSDLGRDFHILVVDDGSTDGTSGVLESYGRVLSLTVLRHDEPRGYAASLERLIREAVSRSDYPRRDALVTLQGDFTDAPEVITVMLRRFEGGMDLVTCARPASDGPAVEEVEEDEAIPDREPTSEPRPVRVARLGARLVARGLRVPESVSDPFGSLRLYRLFVLERALGELSDRDAPLVTQDGWAANLELLLAVWPHVRRVEEVVSPPDYGRRYRDSRFRALGELWSLGRAAFHPRLRSLERRAASGG